MNPLAHPNLISRNRPPVFHTALIAAMTVIALSPATGMRAQEPAANTPRTTQGEVHTTRPTIAVLSVDDLDEAGRAHAQSSQNGRGDAINLALAEEAITRSRAYQIYARDLLAEQAKEIKLDAEGFVEASSAQKFGKGAGIERFLQVFVTPPTSKRFMGQNVDDSTVPTSGEPVTGSVYIEPPSDTNNSDSGGKIFGKKVKPGPPPTRRDLVQATATIRCRFTDVSTGKSATQSFDGIATADAGHSDSRRLAQAAVQDAFNNFEKDLSKNRTVLMANVTEVVDGKGLVVVDMGEADGLVKDMAFEICEISGVAGFNDYTRVCDARVTRVKGNTALLEIGEYKRDILRRGWTFHGNEDKAKLIHKGCVAQEKKF